MAQKFFDQGLNLLHAFWDTEAYRAFREAARLDPDAAMPYWGGGAWEARRLRANDRMYYELMLHARRRGCSVFDFGRSKTGSGAWHFKHNWGFVPEALTYASWTAPGAPKREADPASSKLSLQIALWQKLPIALANRIGPLIARGIG